MSFSRRLRSRVRSDSRARADVARYAPADYPDGEPVQPDDVDVTVTAIAAVLEQTACDLLDFEHFESELDDSVD